MGKKKSPYELQAAAASAEDRAIAAQQRQREEEATGRAQRTYGQFEGPVQESPFYRALLTSGTEATSRAYEGARAGARRRGQLAGFGYTQPITQGAENELGERETSALAAVPRESLLAATGPALEAARGETGIGGRYGGEALGYTSSGRQNLELAAKLDEQARRRRAGLWKTLAGVGLTAAAPFTGGLSAALPGALGAAGGGLLGGGEG